MGRKRNINVCPVCNKIITSEFKLYPQKSEDKTVCEKCSHFCHRGCAKRVRDNYLSFIALEYSVCLKCYPKIEEEDQLNRKIADAEGYEEYMEAKSKKFEEDTDSFK